MRTTQWPATAPLFGSQPRRPSCVCSGLEPHCRTSRYARPQPTPLPRYCSLTSLLRSCSRRPLIAAGHPLRSSVPSPSCNRSGFGTPPPHRPAYYNCVLLPGSSSLPGPAVRLATRETITTPPPNVYSGDHRFCGIRGRGNLLLTPRGLPPPERPSPPSHRQPGVHAAPGSAGRLRPGRAGQVAGGGALRRRNCSTFFSATRRTPCRPTPAVPASGICCRGRRGPRGPLADGRPVGLARRNHRSPSGETAASRTGGISAGTTFTPGVVMDYSHTSMKQPAAPACAAGRMA
jgi:hypothetical protein